jgi:hypothetical protein
MLKVNGTKTHLTVGKGVFVYETDGIVTLLLDAKSRHAKVVRLHLKSIWANNIKTGRENAIKAQNDWLATNSRRRGQIWYVDDIPCYARALGSERFTSDAWPALQKKIKYAKNPDKVQAILDVLNDHSNLEFKPTTPWKVVQGYMGKLDATLELAQTKYVTLTS